MRLRLDLRFQQLIDFEDPRTLKAIAWSLPLAVTIGGLTFLLSRGTLTVLWALFAFVGTMVVVPAIVLGLANLSARGATSFVAPSASSTPSIDEYSHEKALIARGEVAEALSLLSARLSSHPEDPALCLFAADVYARSAEDAARAARLYIRAREMRAATPAQDYLATNRLIDLYMGALDDPRRGAEELERIRDRHSGSTAAAHAERVLRELRGTPPPMPPRTH